MRIVKEHNLRILAKQIRGFMYSCRDQEELGHAWWHEQEYPFTLTAKYVDELCLWAKIVI